MLTVQGACALSVPHSTATMRLRTMNVIGGPWMDRMPQR